MENAGASTIRCAVCLGWRLPIKILRCGHSYCQRCLVGVVDPSGYFLNCPTCREWTAVPLQGVDRLPTNFALQQVLHDVGVINYDDSTTVELEVDRTVAGSVLRYLTLPLLSGATPSNLGTDSTRSSGISRPAAGPMDDRVSSVPVDGPYYLLSSATVSEGTVYGPTTVVLPASRSVPWVTIAIYALRTVDVESGWSTSTAAPDSSVAVDTSETSVYCTASSSPDQSDSTMADNGETDYSNYSTQ